jgi:hypothetical protein
MQPVQKKKTYYDLHIKWKHGFNYHNYIEGYSLKSTKNSLEKLDWFDSVDIKEITEEEYNKKLGMSYELDSSASEAPKKRKKKVVKDV